jgi:hypothetical protein
VEKGKKLHAKLIIMREDFLHFVWQYQQFDTRFLKTTQGQTLTILRPGKLNSHAGPDFYEAHLILDDLKWIGQVEVHLTTSDWVRHGHAGQLHYNHVILHVVYEETIKIYRTDGSEIPCLVLKDRIFSNLSKLFRQLISQKDTLPCTFYWPYISPLTKRKWMETLSVERMEVKMETLKEHYFSVHGDWEQLAFQGLASNMGLMINTEPFLQVARSLDIKKLQRLKNLFQIEAILFGQANLLSEPNHSEADEYRQQLSHEYLFQQQKFNLTPIPPGQWRYMRMRPSGFPEKRMAALAGFIFQTEHIKSKLITLSSKTELSSFFDIRTSLYWKNHFRFGKKTMQNSAAAGQDLIHRLAINFVIPFQFLFADINQLPEVKERGLALLLDLDVEDNVLIRQWKKMGIIPVTAAESQSLIHLKKEYCDKRLCLSCAIGHAILRGNTGDQV